MAPTGSSRGARHLSQGLLISLRQVLNFQSRTVSEALLMGGLVTICCQNKRSSRGSARVPLPETKAGSERPTSAPCPRSDALVGLPVDQRVRRRQFCGNPPRLPSPHQQTSVTSLAVRRERCQVRERQGLGEKRLCRRTGSHPGRAERQRSCTSPVSVPTSPADGAAESGHLRVPQHATGFQRYS